MRLLLLSMGAVLIVICDPTANDAGQDERENDFQKLEQLSTHSGMFRLFLGRSHERQLSTLRD